MKYALALAGVLLLGSAMTYAQEPVKTEQSAPDASKSEVKSDSKKDVKAVKTADGKKYRKHKKQPKAS